MIRLPKVAVCKRHRMSRRRMNLRLSAVEHKRHHMTRHHMNLQLNQLNLQHQSYNQIRLRTIRH